MLWLVDNERPTSGYAIRLLEPSLETTADSATVRIVSMKPSSDYTAQVFTRPCLVVAIPAASYRRIDILDQDGRQWGVAKPR